MDLSDTIKPKSDQLNTEDLFLGPRTITVRKIVKKIEDEKQPMLVYFEGDNDKPWKPCVTIRRVLIHFWGKEGKWEGNRATIFCDPKVDFGDQKGVGGIRVSHISGIDKPSSVNVTVTRGRKKLYTVLPIADEPAFDRAGNLAKLEAAAAKGYDTLVAEWKTIKGNKALTDEWGRLKELATQADAAKSQQSEAAKD